MSVPLLRVKHKTLAKVLQNMFACFILHVINHVEIICKCVRLVSKSSRHWITMNTLMWHTDVQSPGETFQWVVPWSLSYSGTAEPRYDEAVWLAVAI